MQKYNNFNEEEEDEEEESHNKSGNLGNQSMMDGPPMDEQSMVDEQMRSYCENLEFFI